MCKFFSVIGVLLCTVLGAQNLDQINSNNGFHNVCTDQRIKSIELYRTGDFRNPAIIMLGSNQQLELHFDDLLMADLSERDFYYTIVLANAEWKEERLLQTEYLTGFPENDITSYQSSLNTSINYSHYQLFIPNDEVQIKLSGNYFLRVFDRSTRKQIFQRCFSVTENLVSIKHDVHLPLNGIKDAHQINFSIQYGQIKLTDPYRELIIKLKQNNCFGLTDQVVPSFVQNGIIDYSRPDKNIFKAGNEFRTFDIRNLSFSGLGVEKTWSERGIANVLLLEDVSRDHVKYSDSKDINGLFMIGADRTYNSTNQPDYVNVHFRFKHNLDPKTKVYLFGALSNWTLKPELELIYSAEQDCYQTSVLLKQAFYNYQYILVNQNNEMDMLEGNYFDTENNYSISVYFRPIGARFDRLLGYTSFSSRNFVQIEF